MVKSKQFLPLVIIIIIAYNATGAMSEDTTEVDNSKAVNYQGQ